MPIRPRSGSRRSARQRKSWSSSSAEGCLKAWTSHPLRVDARHDVLDRAVLARRVHRLEDQQHRPAVLGVELLLQLGEALHAELQQRLGLLFVDVEPGGVAGIVVGEMEAFAFAYPVTVDDFGGVHEAPSPCGQWMLDAGATQCKRAWLPSFGLLWRIRSNLIPAATRI